MINLLIGIFKDRNVRLNTIADWVYFVPLILVLISSMIKMAIIKQDI